MKISLFMGQFNRFYFNKSSGLCVRGDISCTLAPELAFLCVTQEKWVM